MRGEGAPSPIYEGEDSVIAWMLDGPKARLPGAAAGTRANRKRAILDSFTKEHSAEYQSQALIDLAFRMREKIADLEQVEKIVIHTSHHTHYVIGTGANDPQKMDPKGQPRDAGPLDHVYLRRRAAGRRWHHVDSYAPKRAGRADTVRLWHKIETTEDPEWSAAILDRSERMRSAAAWRSSLRDGTTLVDEMAVANAHPLGARPFGRPDYIGKFRTLTDGIVSTREANRFLEVAQVLPPAAGGRTASVERRAARGHAGGRQAGHYLTIGPTSLLSARFEHPYLARHGPHFQSSERD
jgi:2-methylcitrate dehydratase